MHMDIVSNQLAALIITPSLKLRGLSNGKPLVSDCIWESTSLLAPHQFGPVIIHGI
jgi:hypothetical protein